MAKVLYRAPNGAVLLGPPYTKADEAAFYKSVANKGPMTVSGGITRQPRKPAKKSPKRK